MAPAVDLSTLPPMDVAGRLGRLRAGLAASGVDGLLVTKLENVRYLTGFSGSAGMLHVPVAGGAAVLLTDGRYRDQSAAELAAAGVDARVEVAGGPAQLEALAGLVAGGRGSAWRRRTSAGRSRSGSPGCWRRWSSWPRPASSRGCGR
ncbi:MAG: aminopeptidase P family N-terminal domain-containing protein [Actinomycetota bacterium]|nr:aminopeptidase P family N-terminal domain-containing protein [Actinomycetota bacterium]